MPVVDFAKQIAKDFFSEGSRGILSASRDVFSVVHEHFFDRICFLTSYDLVQGLP